MTLLDAPQFDKAGAQRRSVMLYGGAGLVVVLIVGFWLVAGRPIDWPWTWWDHLVGRSVTNHFLAAVEHNDLQKAYAIWLHDKDWQQHQSQITSYPFTRFQEDKKGSNMSDKDLYAAYGAQIHDKDWRRHEVELSSYPFSRFQEDWSPTSSGNEYGVIQTHKIAAAHVEGNVLLMAVLINGRKSGALNLIYAPDTHELNFSPPDMEINPAYYRK
jgi:hypothetical protein